MGISALNKISVYCNMKVLHLILIPELYGLSILHLILKNGQPKQIHGDNGIGETGNHYREESVDSYLLLNCIMFTIWHLVLCPLKILHLNYKKDYPKEIDLIMLSLNYTIRNQILFVYKLTKKQ